MSTGFVVAAGVGVDSAYWGRIIISMTLMAARLALTSGPATDAIMGAVLPGKAGAGSAVNDMTRELGGTLDVAVVGLGDELRLRPACAALADEPRCSGCRRRRRPSVSGGRAHRCRAPASRPSGRGRAGRTAGVRRRALRRLAGRRREHRRSGRRSPGVPPGPRQGTPSWQYSSPGPDLEGSKRLVLTFTGRRSGTRYTTPVNYLQRGREVLITTDSK